MKTIQQVEKENNISLPNPYFHDHKNHAIPTITFIWFAITPTGRFSHRKFEQLRFYKGDKYPTLETALQRIKENYTPHPAKLPKGYKWSEAMVHHDFWEVGYDEKTESVNWHENEHDEIFAKY